MHETLRKTPLQGLGLRIEGTPLEPATAQLLRELDEAGIVRARPSFYLTTDWVVHDETLSIGIPFYLARPDLLALHAEQEGHVEGATHDELMRYLRHEMGHVVSYAYKLFEREEWVEAFGSMTQPYEDEYRPEPFSRRYVVHLPGWYAQKHPDEDWAETFAVWLTPGRDWRAEYAEWPAALAKLELCDRLVKEVRGTDPPVTAYDETWGVDHLEQTLEEHYAEWAFKDDIAQVAGIDGALRAVFDEGGTPAAELFRACERAIMAEVFRFTGHFPERTRALLRKLAARAEALGLGYRDERSASVGLSVLAASLAMNHVHRGAYLPSSSEVASRE
ncbi:MAG: putative zinc-binding metallopeptidase [Gemmataceae bacterium]|nr:putative zinc-binding metallopeptidase [Gemmataceae bacterium]